jgi:pyruvate,water dikinase
LVGRLLRLFSWIDARREWFRDQFMRTCQGLRRRVLECGARLCAAGELDVPEDVFWLRGSDLNGAQPLCEAIAEARANDAAVREVELPITATREVVEALLARAENAQVDVAAERTFSGISLGAAIVEGRVLKAKDLMTLLAEVASAPHVLGSDTILVVPALEPSWAVLFPRVAGVVADVGGELSHASILLREAGKPALVNCTGIFRQVQSGDRLRLDGKRGLAILLIK